MGYLQGRSRRPPAEWATVVLCRWLNGHLGTRIAPWELGQVPEYWLELIVTGITLEGELAEAGLGRG